MKVAALLRAEGLKVDVALAGGPLGKIMQQAQAAGAAWGVIVGSGAGGEVEVRDLATRVSEKVSVGNLAAWISERKS